MIPCRALVKKSLLRTKPCGTMGFRNSDFFGVFPIESISRVNSRSFSAGRVRRESRQPVRVTPNATKFFCHILDSKKALGVEDVVAVQLGYRQSVSSPAMVYTFDFLDNSDIFACKTRRPPDEYTELDKGKGYLLYVHPNALMKVLGATVDVDLDTLQFLLKDEEGHLLVPD